MERPQRHRVNESTEGFKSLTTLWYIDNSLNIGLSIYRFLFLHCRFVDK
jgi:hypothetical protein